MVIFPISKLGVRRSFQVQTATSHQPFHPGLCVSLFRARLSRLRLTQQSLKRVVHEGKPCLKGEQTRHPPCLSNRPIVLGVIGVTRTWYITDILYYVAYMYTTLLVDNSHLHTTPHHRLPCSILLFAFVTLSAYVWSRVKWGLHQGVAQLQQEFFSPNFEAQIPPCGYLSGKYRSLVDMAFCCIIMTSVTWFLSTWTIFTVENSCVVNTDKYPVNRSIAGVKFHDGNRGKSRDFFSLCRDASIGGIIMPYMYPFHLLSWCPPLSLSDFFYRQQGLY